MGTWEKIQREVMLKANQLNAADASTLASVYSVTSIGQTQLNDRGIEFPFSAINDSILDAGGKIVNAIGHNINSPYRSYFHDQTDSISDGGRIQELSQAGHPKVGFIGAVYDSSTGKELELVSRPQVDGADALPLRISPHLYFTDQQRIWHTRTSVVADIVVWEAQVERYWMEASVRGDCPFPDSLNDVLVSGALTYLFRSKFNMEQADQWGARFQDGMSKL
jgi:hypothetical protein